MLFSGEAEGNSSSSHPWPNLTWLRHQMKRSFLQPSSKCSYSPPLAFPKGFDLIIQSAKHQQAVLSPTVVWNTTVFSRTKAPWRNGSIQVGENEDAWHQRLLESVMVGASLKGMPLHKDKIHWTETQIPKSLDSGYLKLTSYSEIARTWIHCPENWQNKTSKIFFNVRYKWRQ